MSIKKLSFSLLLLPVASFADYRTEITASATHVSIGKEETRETARIAGQENSTVVATIPSRSVDTQSLTLTYYLEPVVTEGVALREASFLQAASSLKLAAMSGDSEAWEVDGTFILNTLILGASYSQQEKWNPFVSGGPFGIVETDDLPDVDHAQLTAGKYLSDNTSLSVVYDYRDIDEDKEYHAASIQLRSVIETYGGKDVGGQITFGSGEIPGANTVNFVTGTLDYYFSNKFSVGAMMDMRSANGIRDDERIFGVRSDYFITENLAISAAFDLTLIEESKYKQITGEELSVSEIRRQRSTQAFKVELVGRF